MKQTTSLSLLAAGLFTAVAATPVLAADVIPTVQPAAPTTSIGIEYDPEFNAISSSTKSSFKNANALADSYIKASISHIFDNSWIIGGSFSYYIKENHGKTAESNKDTYQRYAESTLGYRYNVWGPFSLTPTVTLGYTWGATGIVKGATTNNDVAYYALNLAGDWKLTRQWTWNVFNLRYRNAFGYRWETPKAVTGVTYNIDANDAVYVSAGYAWKSVDNKGAAGHTGLLEDKWNMALGYRRSF